MNADETETQQADAAEGKGNRQWQGYLLALLAFLLFLGAQLAAGLIAAKLINAFDLTDRAPVAKGMCMLFVDAILLLLVMALRLVPVPIMPTRRTDSAALWGWGMGGILLLSLGMGLLTGPFELNGSEEIALLMEMARNPMCLFLLCVVGPLTEEVVFRGAMQGQMRSKGIAAVTAVVVTALLFAISHMNLAQGIPAFIVGTGLGILLLKTGNLGLCIAAHIVNNSLAVAEYILPEPFKSLETLLPPVATMALGGALALMGAACLQRFMRTRIKEA